MCKTVTFDVYRAQCCETFDRFQQYGKGYPMRSRTQSPKEEDSALLDNDEQDAVVASLKSQAAYQSGTTRTAFGIIFSVVSGIFVFCFISFTINPWSMVHQMRFEDTVSIYVFLAFYVLSATTFATCAAIVTWTIKHISTLLWIPILVASVGSAVGWIVIFWELKIDVLLLYWLPFGNLCGILLALYVDRDMSSLVADSENMDSLKYNLKTA